MKNQSIVITGCGVITSIGSGRTESMANLLQGKKNFCAHRLVHKTKEWDHSVAYVSEEQLNAGIPLRSLRKLDRFTLLSMQVFQQAHHQAAIPEEFLREFGVLLGNSTGGWSFVEPQMDDICKGNLDAISPYVATAWFPTAPQGELSIQYKMSGYSKTIAADALSCGYALDHAGYLIEQGYLPGAFVGGVEAPLSSIVYNACVHREPLAASGRYLPYHKKSDGYLLGEGAGLLAIESTEHVKARGGTALARIAGMGIASDLSEAIQTCLDEANRLPSQIDCIFLDAKGTQEYDQKEYLSLAPIFRGCDHVELTTTKTLHGSLLAADFAVQLVLAVFVLESQKIPCGLSSEEGHEKPPFGRLVLDRPIEKNVKNVLVYARNLDGSSICALIEKIH